MIGRMTSTLSETRLQKYSLFQKYKARSATCYDVSSGRGQVKGMIHLKMRAGNRLCQLVKQWFLDLGKLRRIHDLKDVFHLVQKHDFFAAIDLRPVAEQAQHNLTASEGSGNGLEILTSSVNAASFSKNWTMQ